ncbi:transposase, IS481 family [Bordetella pertussis STO1-CHOC-0019]|nr:transposase, IS481 family [Bordetella pertussis STO1-CHOC-0019]
MAGPLPGSGPGGLGPMRPRADGLAPSDCAGQGAGYRGAAPQAADPSAHRQPGRSASPSAASWPAPAVAQPGHLADLEPAEPVVRYEHQAPGDLLHIDIKKLGRIQRPGHRVTGNRRDTVEGAGWDFVFVAIDDHARVAFTDIHPDERFPSAVQFLKDAVAYYQRLGVTIQRLLTDNGSAFRSRAFAALCHELGIKHRFTRPYRPQTNGKAERFIQSALREWAYAHTYQNSQHRADAMKSWLHHYNWHRPHQGIGRAVPISRLNLDEYNLLTVHT